jgi:hypothetical protein
MRSVLGEWREGKVRPLPGNAPHDRPVSRGLHSPRSICDDPFPATRFPLLSIPGTRNAFSKAWRNLSVRCGPKQNQPWVGTLLPPAGRPRAQVKERAGRIAIFSSSAMSSGRLFLDRVARQQSPSPLHRHAQTTMHPCRNQAKQDISTLQGIGHFYFALTRFGLVLVSDRTLGWSRTAIRAAGWSSAARSAAAHAQVY